MVFKLNISENGKSWKLDSEGDFLVGRSIGEKVEGKELGGDFEGYELEIKGGTDFAGFPLSKEIEGVGLRRVLRTKGWGMWDNRSGIRKRKTVRGKTISENTIQINFNVVKVGGKKLGEIFPDQNKVADEKASETGTPDTRPEKSGKREEAKVEEEKNKEKKDDGKVDVKEKEKAEVKIEEQAEEKAKVKKEEVREEIKKEGREEIKKEVKEEEKKEDNLGEKKDGIEAGTEKESDVQEKKKEDKNIEGGKKE